MCGSKCKQEFRIPDGSTTSLSNHLKTRHRMLINDDGNKELSSTVNTTFNANNIKKHVSNLMEEGTKQKFEKIKDNDLSLYAETINHSQ